MADNDRMPLRLRIRPAAPLVAVLSGAAVLSGGAFGAGATSADTSATTERGSSSRALPAPELLTEVVVTARRRDEALWQVGASLSRLEPGITGVIDRTHAAEALNRVPGVLMQRGSGQESLLAIRSPVLTGAGACGAFLLLEDGMPLRPTGFCNVNQLFEANTSQAAAIEVLRGPGTGPYGANAVHGLVNVISPDPGALPRLRLGVTRGADDHLALQFAASDKAGADEASAVYGTWRDERGFRSDSPVREWKANAAHQRALGSGELRLRATATRLDQETAGFIRGFDAYRDPVLRESNPNPEAFRDADSARVSGEWLAEPCDGCRDEVRGIVRRSRMEFLQHFLLGKPLERNGQDSVAIGAARTRPLGERAIEWRLGVDAEYADTFLLEIQDGPTLEGSAFARAIRPAGRHYDYAVEVTGAALHGSLASTGESPFQWRLSARLDETRYRYDNRMRDGNTAEDGTPCVPGPCLYSRPADRTDRFTDFTPRLELQYRVGARSMLYVTASDGFRPPEITELYRLQRNQSVADLDSERMSALEAGWRLAGERYAVSLSAYTQRKRQVILRDANGFNVTGGRTRHAGLEYEFAWQPVTALRFDANGSYARHEYDFDAAIEGGETIVRGRDIDTAPRRLHSWSATWIPHPAWQATLEWRQVGAYFADAANARRYPGHDVGNLRVAWQASPRWRASLEVENLADTLYADRADFAQGDWRYFPARQRSVFVNVVWQSE
jgi:outer membrane receptor protein involved in Fe transport